MPSGTRCEAAFGRLLRFQEFYEDSVYLEGFNLYYGCLKGSPYRWLNLEALCRIMLPNDPIQQIKYFTARITTSYDPTRMTRQETYLRALGTLPTVSIIYGHYLTDEVKLPLAGQPSGQPPRLVKVIKNEEKGSDVKLAAHLLVDACRNIFDIAVVVSNDSDLSRALKRSLFPPTLRASTGSFHKPAGWSLVACCRRINAVSSVSCHCSPVDDRSTC